MATVKKKIRFKLEVTPSAGKNQVISGFNELNDNITKALENLYRKTFGTETSLQDWAGGNRARVQSKLKNKVATKLNRNPLALDKLIDAYVAAWSNKYKKTIRDYRSNDPLYTDKSWYKWKKKNKGKLAPVHRPGTKVRFLTWGLTTGYLRDSISRGFNAGGNNNLTVSNLLLQGGFEVNFENYTPKSGGRSHYEYFIDLLIKNGTIADSEDFLDFAPSDWNKIASIMFFYVKNNFVDEFQAVIDQVKAEI